MQLIANWKDAWKFASNIIIGALSVFDIVYANYQAFQAYLTPGQFATLNTVLGAAAIVARIVRQNIPTTPEVKEELVANVEALPEKAPT